MFSFQYEVLCDLNPEQPLCYIDTQFWEKIVFNLIGNAFKCECIHVGLSYSAAEHSARYDVRKYHHNGVLQ